jgi:hypothetical protein
MENPFAECIEELFDERTMFKETNPAVADAIKLILNSLYGKQVQKPESKSYKVVSSLHAKNMTDEVESIVSFGEKSLIISKSKPGKQKNDLFGCLILAYSKVIMNEFVDIADGFSQSNIYCTDTDSLFMHKKYLKRF